MASTSNPKTWKTGELIVELPQIESYLEWKGGTLVAHIAVDDMALDRQDVVRFSHLYAATDQWS